MTWAKLYTLSGGNYDGYAVWHVSNHVQQETVEYNFNGPLIFGYKQAGVVAGLCPCNDVLEGTYINAWVVLYSIH